MFSSKAPEDLPSFDDGSWRERGDEPFVISAPPTLVRQYNRPNPALLHFCEMHGDRSGLDLHHAAVAWWASLPNLVLAGAYGYREGAHARRVLLHLANLTKETA